MEYLQARVNVLASEERHTFEDRTVEMSVLLSDGTPVLEEGIQQ